VFFRFTPDFPCLSLFVFFGVSPGLDIFRGCGGLRERRSVPSPGGVDQKLAWKEQKIGDLTMKFPCFLVNAIIYIQQFHHYPIIIHTFCGIWMTLRIFVWIILMIIVYYITNFRCSNIPSVLGNWWLWWFLTSGLTTRVFHHFCGIWMTLRILFGIFPDYYILRIPNTYVFPDFWEYIEMPSTLLGSHTYTDYYANIMGIGHSDPKYIIVYNNPNLMGIIIITYAYIFQIPLYNILYLYTVSWGNTD